MIESAAIVSPATSNGRRAFVLTVLIFSLGYATYFASKAVFVVCSTPLLILLIPFPQAKYRLLQMLTGGFLAFFTRRWLPLIGMYRIVEISGLEKALAQGPVVLAANHRGFLDSLLMLGLVPRLGVLIKSRYTRQRTYSLLARHFDLVSIEPSRLSSVSAAMDSCQRLLAAGKNLLVYPEGSRARSGRLQPFNPLAFELAKCAGVPVVPVVIHSSQPFMAKLPGSIFPRGRNEYHIRFLDPATPRADETATELCDRVHRRMAQELKTLDAGTIWETLRTARGPASQEPFTGKTP